jgi:AcrR family transcriptional regulator
MLDTKKTVAPKKRLILETAAGLFIEKGFHQTSIRDIAKTAGISLGNLYNHFSGKNELIAAIALLETEENYQLELILQVVSTPYESYEKFIDSYLSIHSEEANAVLSAEIQVEALRNPEVGTGFIANHKKLTEKLVWLLNQGKNNSEMQFDNSSEITANLIIDMLDSGCIKSLFYEGESRSNYLAQLKQLCLRTVGCA